MSVTSAQIIQVTGMSDAELFRMRDVAGVAGAGSGNPLTYDELTADIMVSVWFAISSAIASFGRTGISYNLWRYLAAELKRNPDQPAQWRRGHVTISLTLLRTDWSTVNPGPSRRKEFI